MQAFPTLTTLLSLWFLFSKTTSHDVPSDVSDNGNNHLLKNAKHNRDDKELANNDTLENSVSYNLSQVDFLSDFKRFRELLHAKELKRTDEGQNYDRDGNSMKENPALNNKIENQQVTQSVNGKEGKEWQDDRTIEITEPNDHQNKAEDNAKYSSPHDYTIDDKNQKSVMPNPEPDGSVQSQHVPIPSEQQSEQPSEQPSEKGTDYDELNQILYDFSTIDETKLHSDKPKIQSQHTEKKMDTISEKAYLQENHQNTDNLLKHDTSGNGPSNISLNDMGNNSTDRKLWIGVGMGVGGCLTLAVLVVVSFLVFKKRRGCNQWRKLTESSFTTCVKDEQPVYIKLSQLHGQRRHKGFNYVITVLDESNFSVDSSLSSEDELFGATDLLNRTIERAKEKSVKLGSPQKTSTPVKKNKSFRT